MNKRHDDSKCDSKTKTGRYKTREEKEDRMGESPRSRGARWFNLSGICPWQVQAIWKLWKIWRRWRDEIYR